MIKVLQNASSHARDSSRAMYSRIYQPVDPRPASVFITTQSHLTATHLCKRYTEHVVDSLENKCMHFNEFIGMQSDSVQHTAQVVLGLSSLHAHTRRITHIWQSQTLNFLFSLYK